MNGILVEHDGREFVINHGDGSLTLIDVSQSRYAERETARRVCYIIHCVYIVIVTVYVFST